MKLLSSLFLFALLLSSCGSDSNTETTNTAPVAETPEPVKTYPPEEGCAFAMKLLKGSPDGKHKAVAGTKRCDDGRVFQEVVLYTNGEAINNKKANVYSVPDTMNPITIAWSADTLVVTHHSPGTEPTLQEFSADGVQVMYAVDATKGEL